MCFFGTRAEWRRIYSQNRWRVFFPTLLLPCTIPPKCVASTPCLPSSSVLNILSFHYMYFWDWFCALKLPYSVLQVGELLTIEASWVVFSFCPCSGSGELQAETCLISNHHLGASLTVISLRLSENSHLVCFLPSSWLLAQSPLVSDSSSPLLCVCDTTDAESIVIMIKNQDGESLPNFWSYSCLIDDRCVLIG